MKKIILAFTVIAMTAQPALAQDRVLKVAMDTDPYPPFTFDGPNGSFGGFEVDLLQAYCQEMKVECQIQRVAWDGIIPALQSGKVDMVFNSMSITPEREKAIDFSNPYYQTKAVFAAPKSEKLTLTPEGLKGKIVGVKAGTIHANYAKSRLNQSTVRVYPSQDQVDAELVSGRIDVALDDSLTMVAFMKTPAASKLEVKGEVPQDPLMGTGIGAGIRKGDEVLRSSINNAIASVASDGRYQQIMHKYFEVDISPR